MNRFKGLDLVDRLPEELQTEVHNTVQEMMVKTKIRLILFFAPEDGEDIYSQQKQPGDDCSSDHELLIAKSR